MSSERAKKILLAFHAPDTLAEAARSLRASGFVVAMARDGRRALELIEQEKPEVVVLEVGMAGINGYQACRRLRDGEGTSSIRTLLIGEKCEPADLYWAEQVGALALLQSPIDMRLLVQHVEAALEESTQ